MSADNSAKSGEFVHLQRMPDGRFAPGSGGRIPGSKNRISNEALRAVRDMKDGAIVQLRQRLAENDWNAIEFVLSRVLPKGRMIELDASSPAAIQNALASGELTTDEARNLATVLEKLASIEEVTELRRRIEALERIADAK